MGNIYIYTVYIYTTFFSPTVRLAIQIRVHQFLFWAALSLLRFQAMQFLTDLKKAAKGQREDEAAPQPVVDDAPCGWWSVDVRMITGDELSVRAKKTSGLKIGISCHWKYHRSLCYFWDGVL